MCKNICDVIKNIENLPNRKDYSIELKKWILELCTKNLVISLNPAKEKVGRKRWHIYHMDFGVNVGSEFNHPHYCLVLKEFGNTAIISPITKKDERNEDEKLFSVNLGVLNYIPNNKNKDSYVLLSQIKAVSKQRLNIHRENGKIIERIISEEQKKNILDCLNRLFK